MSLKYWKFSTYYSLSWKQFDVTSLKTTLKVVTRTEITRPETMATMTEAKTEAKSEDGSNEDNNDGLNGYGDNNSN